MLCIYIGCIETLGLDVLFSHVSEDDLSLLLCIYSEYMEIFAPHELILCVSEDHFSALLCMHSESTDAVCGHHDAAEDDDDLYGCPFLFLTPLTAHCEGAASDS